MVLAGLFITFEGVDGCGKTTQIKLLAESLRETGRDVQLTREPGGTVLGERIRKILLEPFEPAPDPLSELFLFNSARTELMRQVVLPALEAGQVVLCDRFIDSTLAYQGYARGLDIDFVKTICTAATCGRQPDRTILFEIDEHSALARSRTRLVTERSNETRFEMEGIEFQRKVSAGFFRIAKANCDRIKRVDANRTPAQIGKDVCSVLTDLLPELAGETE